MPYYARRATPMVWNPTPPFRGYDIHSTQDGHHLCE